MVMCNGSGRLWCRLEELCYLEVKEMRLKRVCLGLEPKRRRLCLVSEVGL